MSLCRLRNVVSPRMKSKFVPRFNEIISLHFGIVNCFFGLYLYVKRSCKTPKENLQKFFKLCWVKRKHFKFPVWKCVKVPPIGILGFFWLSFPDFSETLKAESLFLSKRAWIIMNVIPFWLSLQKMLAARDSGIRKFNSVFFFCNEP